MVLLVTFERAGIGSECERQDRDRNFNLPASRVNGMQPNSEKNQMIGRKSIQPSSKVNVQFAIKSDVQDPWAKEQ